LSQIALDKKRYENSTKSFKDNSQAITKIGLKMLEQLDVAHLNALTEKTRKNIDGSWTTMGLNISIKQLVKDAIAIAQEVTLISQSVENLSVALYLHFHDEHGFEKLAPPLLNINNFVSKMENIAEITEKFCSDPINLMTEKHYLIRRFFKSLGVQVELVFDETRKNIRYWLQDILSPLLIQLNEHKAILNNRSESLRQLHKSDAAAQKAIAQALQAVNLVQSQCTDLDKMLLTLMKDHTKSSVSKEKTEANATLLDIVLN
jgi:hypothetical protein